MIVELYIQNFAIIDEVRIEFEHGFNVLTGETGAGKSIILDAMALVLGERADTTVIREGSAKAYVEVFFRLDDEHGDHMRSTLAKEGLEGEGDDQLVLSRELRSNGRSISRVNGRTVNLAFLRSLGDALVDIHGQGEHLSLLKPTSHLPLLDAFGSLESEREAFAAAVGTLRDIRKELTSLRQDEAALARRADLLSYQIEEINAAELTAGEDVELETERTQLTNVEQLILQGNEVLELLEGINSDTPSAGDLIGQAEMSLTVLGNLDKTQKPLAEKLRDLNFQLSDVVSEVTRYCEQLEHSPYRLDEVEERLELVKMLKRKYGGSIEAVMEHLENAQSELEAIENSDVRMQDLEAQEEDLLRRLGSLGETLSNNRKKAALSLAADVENELSALSMLQARFEVEFTV